MLQAAAYNATHAPIVGPALPENMAAQRYRDEQQEVANIQQIEEAYRSTGNEVISVNDPAQPGNRLTFTGHSPRQNGFAFNYVNADGDHIYTIQDTTADNHGDTWNSETGTLTINHMINGTLIHRDNMRYESRAGNIITYRHADGSTYTHDVTGTTPDTYTPV